MPIYAYKCGSCGHAKDVLQKLSDAPLTVCTACGAHAFSKQVTAAGFQLKGSGWYVTDFRGGNTAAGGPDKPESSPDGAPAAAPAAPAAAATAEAPKKDAPRASESSAASTSGSSSSTPTS